MGQALHSAILELRSIRLLIESLKTLGGPIFCKWFGVLEVQVLGKPLYE